MNLAQKYINWYNKTKVGKMRTEKYGREATVADLWGDWSSLKRLGKKATIGTGKTAGKGLLGIILGFIAGLFVGIPMILLGVFILLPISLFLIATIIGAIIGIPLLLVTIGVVIVGAIVPFLSATGGGIGGIFHKA
jgi:hypothetical protein